VQQFLASHARATGLASPARSVMTRGIPTCLSYASLKHAVQLLRNAGRNAVPVVDGDGRLLGIVSERDMCDAACMQGKRFSEMTVDTALTENPYSCSPEDSVARVLEIMSDAQVHELPVVDADRRVLGIIDIASLARFAVESPSAHASTSEALLKAIVALSAAPANDYCTAAE
jgi:CBS domain-containing protein